MIVSVLCPMCGKKIQIDDTNDANICVCCGKAFVTSKAIICDDVVINVEKKTQNNQADHYFNNIVGLLEKGVSNEDEVLKKNYTKFKTEYPLDQRLAVCDYLIQYDKYQRKVEKDFSLINDLLLKLSEIKSKEYYDKYYNLLLKEANELSNTTTNEMLNIKLYLGNFDLDGLKKDINNYNQSSVKYLQDLKICEANLKTYERNLDNFGSSVRSFLSRNEIGIPYDAYLSSPTVNKLNLSDDMNEADYQKEIDRFAKELNTAVNKLSSYERRLDSFSRYSYVDFPMRPVCVIPIVPNKPYLNSKWFVYLNSVAKELKIEEYGIDTEYLYSQYKKINNANLSNYSDVKNILSKIFMLLPKDIQNAIREEEKIKQEQLRKKKEDKILKELKEYWITYLACFKNKGHKAAYKYLNTVSKVENKIVYAHQELNNYKKGLFGVKYLKDINNFDLDENIMMTYQKMNFKL